MKKKASSWIGLQRGERKDLSFTPVCNSEEGGVVFGNDHRNKYFKIQAVNPCNKDHGKLSSFKLLKATKCYKDSPEVTEVPVRWSSLNDLLCPIK